MKITVIVIFLLFILASQGFASEPAEIVLRDGSVIRAEVISLQEGVYTLKSESLGTIIIEQSRIASIKMGSGMSPGMSPDRHASTPSSTTPEVASQTAESNVVGQVNTMREVLMSDQSIMEKLSSLSNDPELMRVVQDPEIMKSVTSGDIKALMANDKFMQLLNNPNIQEISKKISP